MQAIACALALEGATPALAVNFIETVTENRETHTFVHEWKAALARRGASTEAGNWNGCC